MPNTIYDINFSKFSQEQLPPDKRKEPNISIWLSVFASFQWVRDLLFSSYKINSTAPDFAPGGYDKYDQVIYNKKVWYSLIAGNNDTPGETNNWLLVQNNFVGVDERVLYNGEKLIFEWALNKWFGTVFRNPELISDIYITNNAKPVPVFRVGGIEDISSIVYLDHSSEFVVDDYTFGAYANFTIHIPLAVFNALSTTNAERERIVRSFADKYVTCGLFYNVETY